MYGNVNGKGRSLAALAHGMVINTVLTWCKHKIMQALTSSN